MTWQEKVKQLMESNGITQKRLSQLSGITEASISRYLNGNRKVRIDIIVNIAKALGVTTGYLLNEDEKARLEPYAEVAMAIAQNRSLLTAEDKNKLIASLLGN
jgi:transcriptional regulator with XRE-family HTH domain